MKNIKEKTDETAKTTRKGVFVPRYSDTQKRIWREQDEAVERANQASQKDELAWENAEDFQ